MQTKPTKKQFRSALKQIVTEAQPIMVCGVGDGIEGLVLGDVARQHYEANGAGHSVLYVLRDDRRLESVAASLAFYAPDVRVITLPAWDCVPYDRVSPNADIAAARITAMANMIVTRKKKEPVLVLATVNNSAATYAEAKIYPKASALQLKAGSQV